MFTKKGLRLCLTNGQTVDRKKTRFIEFSHRVQNATLHKVL